MALFKINKGLAENLAKNMPYAKEGFAYFTKDDGKFYIDIDGDGTTTEAVINVNRIPLNAAKADVATMIQATAMATDDNKVYPILAFNITDSTKNLVEAKQSQIGIKNGTLVIPSVKDKDEILISNEGLGRGIVIDNKGTKNAIEILNGKGIKVAQDPTENLELTTKQYVDNKLANKSNTGHNHDERYYTEAEIDTKLNALLGANDALVFKGIIDGEHPLPTTGYEVGHTYRVNTAGTYAGQKCEQGDLIICIADALSTSTPHWTVAQTNIDGAVIGPNTSTANAVSTFADETGKVIKDNPAVTIDNTGLFTAPYIATGTNETHYFQSKKFRGEGDANTYYHAVDFGYTGHNQVDFHEYGGTWNFYKNTKGTAADGELVASIQPNGFHGNLNGNATSADKVNNNLVIKLNSGTTEGTNQFTYNGSAVKNINITSSSIGAASSSHNHDSLYVKKSGDTMSGTLRVLKNGIGSDLNNDGVSLANNSILLCSGGYEDYEYFQLGGTSQRPDIFIDRPGNPITLTPSLPRDENIPSEAPALSIRGNNLQNGFTFYIDKLIDPNNSLDTGMGKIWLRSLTNQAVQLKGICGPTEDEDAANKYYVDNQISTKNTNLMGTVSSTYVKKAGDTMTGDLTLNKKLIANNLIVLKNGQTYGTSTPTSGTAGQLFFAQDTSDSDYLPLTGGTLSGNLTLNEKLLITNKMYGTTKPSNPVEGQIFFQENDGSLALPAGGTAGQYLVKNSSNDSDASWKSLPALNYLPLSGGTLTGNLIISRSDANDTYARVTNSKGSIGLLSSTDRGLYDYTNSKWLIYTDGTKASTSYALYGAVWNDYAEFREGDTIEAGHCVVEVGDDTLIISTERMMPGANIVSDTFGFAIGETDQAKTPIAVSGRVLAYPYESREEFKKNIGRPVCSGPNGTVSIMTDEEYRNKGYCAIGTISAVPDYEEWGTGKVKVNGRVWIKV